MAYLYRKKRSPFWYVVYFDPSGKERHRSTGLRGDDPNDTVKAKSLRAELEGKELRRTPSANAEERWDVWVPRFLERHCDSAATRRRYLNAWKWIALWLEIRKLRAPAEISYRAALEYLDWRTGYKKRSGRTVGRNTAILELKLLAMVLGEAVRLGYLGANPLVGLKLKKEKAERKPEISDSEILKMRKLLRVEPEWMQVAFEISLHTGCRLRETQIPIDSLDFTENRITFPAPKGGEERAFSIPMPTALRPLLVEISKKRNDHTLDFPFQPSRRWQQFFQKAKLPHLCFHCLRVTFINRLRRAEVPREVAMRLVNHSSELVHQIYQREKIDDVVKWRDAVSFPGFTN